MTAPVPRTQDRMTHDVFLPRETVELRDEARAAVEKRLVPFAREIGTREESAESFPWEAFRGLAEEGMFAVPFGADFGRGLEYPMLGTCTVTEEIAYHSSSMAGVYDGQCILVPQTLVHASDELRERLVPELVSGRTAFSFATTEPETSSDLTAERMQTVAEESADGYVVSGRKRWITNSVVAGWVSVLVRAADTGRAHMLLVDLSSPGVRIGTPDLKMGHRGQITADIVFDGVHVPRENLLGTPGDGLSVALSALVRGRIGIGAAGVGVAQAALDLSVERLRTRQVFGGPLGAMQHWQFQMAGRATEIECARSLYQKAAVLLDRGDRSAEPEAAMAKAYGTRLANDLVRDAVQIHGAVGFARQVSESGESYRLEEMYRDAKILEIFEGANELQQWIVARRLIGRDVTG
ncbi:acyl-CoA dehydrogenase [Pseudonocardia sp. EC080610-09]|uniref:acyl-CoA dehydrogenase family protein n=1 Tax=unclassified Pseudonocardia TaxID=2619320 RepID=UPI0006CB176D|nr:MULTISPECIES: acyl-CoA dehydrogenase family protein [unclassified Pseudonocardia]ALE75797.1 acyl-CoA dehydrogenase [Pseudonocardia sp. EC080625-04]ALL75175.1 acyl-CoA dehydrogenase [Pseudonocardia sp. EC080610-09]ALL82200.1 acyl-CoA dehydrogenase [Pseudonocardia sp. EC080619-01]